MTAKQLSVDVREAQEAIYAVALSLDAFLVNGIPFGVLQRVGFEGFVQKTADNLLRDLASLEEYAARDPADSRPQVQEALAALRTGVQQLIDRVTGLSGFRALPLDQLCPAVSEIPLLRGECVRRIQDLETYFRTPKPFYSSRPAHSTAAVNAFLSNLDRLFLDEYNSCPTE